MFNISLKLDEPAMERTKKRAYLLEDCGKTFRIENRRQQGLEYEVPLVLYQPQVNRFKHCPNEIYNDEQIRAIKEAIEQAAKRYHESDAKTFLEIAAKYGTFYDSYTVSLRIVLNKDFIRKLSTALAEPKIFLEGTYVPWYYNGTWKKYSWITQDFKILGLSTFSKGDIELKEEQVIDNFEGASRMAEYCKRSQISTGFDLKYSVILEWDEIKFDFPGTEFNLLDKLFDEKLLADCCLVSSEHTEVYCHRNVLAANSSVFLAMFTNKPQQSEKYRIEMIDLCEESLYEMLTYLYKRQINTEGMTEEVALELLQAANKYQISKLEKVMVEMIFRKPADWFSMKSVLAIYFITVNVDNYNMLCDKTLNILKKNPRSVRSSPMYQELMEKYPIECTQLTQKLWELASEPAESVPVKVPGRIVFQDVNCTIT